MVGSVTVLWQTERVAKKNYRKKSTPPAVNSSKRREQRVPISTQPVLRNASLAFLAEVLTREKQFERETIQAVRGARKRGATWDQIAKVMGLSVGAVHNRYALSVQSVKRRTEGRRPSVSTSPTGSTSSLSQ